MDKLPFFLLYTGSWLSICGGIAFLFNFAGDSVKKETKESLARGLKNLDLKREYNWPVTFAALFDRVFTERHFSFTCFWRSCLASFSAVGIMTLVFFVRGGNFGDLFFVVGLLFIVIGAIFLNVFPDYLSLLESRYIIKRMSQTKSSIKLLLWLLVDLIVTGLIFFIFGFLLLNIMDFGTVGFLEYVESFLKEDILFLKGSEGTGVFFYSTFFTSVWVWLYAISGFVLKIVSRTQGGLRFLQDKLDVDNKPFRAMGFTLVLIVTACYFIGGLYMVIF